MLITGDSAGYFISDANLHRRAHSGLLTALRTNYTALRIMFLLLCPYVAMRAIFLAMMSGALIGFAIASGLGGGLEDIMAIIGEAGRSNVVSNYGNDVQPILWAAGTSRLQGSSSVWQPEAPYHEPAAQSRSSIGPTSGHLFSPDSPPIHDPEARKALANFRFPPGAPGVLSSNTAGRLKLGPHHDNAKKTRFWDGDPTALQPVRRLMTRLSKSLVPIDGTDWKDLQMRPLVGVENDTGKRAFYLVDGVALRAKYRQFITQTDYSSLGPGTVGIITLTWTSAPALSAQRLTKHVTRYDYLLVGAMPAWGLDFDFWRAPSDPKYKPVIL
ncbi:hypothetical protein BCV70DRAFT_233899 [Testicularia cyperi]|uniref:Uncharacterized protein n=1 Tax=Testicularia cyperi TaxID=1882483 RepID=A0A317XGR0_9BASI|nr:hypothetical protein BCV70DRAFT_233899 [Testicularia cyperi]